ncbi:hypothetical protein [Azospirillum argentinense]|uniref:hypothetical protein n=1 Tax=Azospirillum argentinense TaxID=2970906 RepID=UPI0032DE87EB
MANEPWIARIGWLNWADGATLTALHPGPATLGVDRLKIIYTGQYHEQTGTELAVRLSFAEPKPVDAVVFPMVNATSAATMRVRANSRADMAGTSLYNYTGTANVDPAINYAIHLLPSTVTAQHWEVAVTDPSLSVSRAGRLVVMPLHRFANNFRPDWNRAWEDISDEREGDDGTMYAKEKPKRRVFTCDFGFLTRAEADDVALEIERVVGKTRDVLLVARPNAPNLGKYTIWGKPLDAGGVSQPNFRVFTKQFKIKERRR